MDIPKDLRYTKTHEWVRLEGDTALIGLTDHAQSELGDIVFISMPEPGDAVTAGEAFADVESVKAVSDVVSPVSGIVCEINEELKDAPERINGQPYQAWIIRVRDFLEEGELLSPEEYMDLVRGGA